MTFQKATMRPERNRLYGLTHEEDGQSIIREPKLLRVGIGAPKGPAILVVYKAPGQWEVVVGYKKDQLKRYPAKDRAEAERIYAEQRSHAPSCPYPRKLDFFTFTRQMGDGNFEPDFGAIEAMGPKPTELDIIFLGDEPLEMAYQMWSSSELRCSGDGHNAARLINMATGKEQQDAARTANARGEKYFPIIGGCKVFGCEFAKEGADKDGNVIPAPCKPHANLRFQLVNYLRVGGTAYFHTTGMKSISQVFSTTERFRSLTGGQLFGLPLKMVLRPFKTNHNGQAGTQYAISLELRAETVDKLRNNVRAQIDQYREIFALSGPSPRRLEAEGGPEPLMIEAPSAPIEDAGDFEGPSAAMVTAEFGGITEEEEQPTPTAPASTPAPDLRTRIRQRANGKADPVPAQPQGNKGSVDMF